MVGDEPRPRRPLSLPRLSPADLMAYPWADVEAIGFDEEFVSVVKRQMRVGIYSRFEIKQAKFDVRGGMA
jgi:hypothetical protein